jgi:hypothetical protein
MKQSERVSVMRVVHDLIIADGIIDLRELVNLDFIRSRYRIKKEDEVVARTYTLSKALSLLSESDKSLRHELMNDCLRISMSDNVCAKEEALLLLALRCCLIGINQETQVYSVPLEEFIMEDAQVLYVESEYNVTANDEICDSYRALRAEMRLAGFELVYLPRVAHHYRAISDDTLYQMAEFLYPNVAPSRLQQIIQQMKQLSTARFCKEQLAQKLGIQSLTTAAPSLLLKVGNSWVNDKVMANFLLVELSDSVQHSIRCLLDVYSDYHQNNQIHYIQEANERFVFRGFYKQIFDILTLRQGVRSRVVLDPHRERIYFPEADAVLDKVHRREKAFYALLLLETSSGGVNFTKPSESGYLERYAKRMQALQEKYSIIYRMFGGTTSKAPNLAVPEIRMPMMSLLKKQIMSLKNVLDQVENYTIQRNIFGCYVVGLSSDLHCCCDCEGTTIELLHESETWRSVAAL